MKDVAAGTLLGGLTLTGDVKTLDGHVMVVALESLRNIML